MNIINFNTQWRLLGLLYTEWFYENKNLKLKEFYKQFCNEVGNLNGSMLLYSLDINL